MAKKDKKLGKASDAARAVQSNPYVQQSNQYLHRLVDDEELRASLLGAYESARNAYGRVSNGKPVSELLDDNKLKREIKDTASALIEASDSLREPTKRRRKGRGVARTLLLLTVSAAAAVALSEGLRTKVLDMMFGAEEEFDYSSTTTPATPAPAAVAGS